jgi:hypothetical protein
VARAVVVADDDDEAIPVVISEEPQAVTEPSPIGAFSIKTRGRGGKKPAAKAAAKSDAQSTAESESSTASANKTYTPLILAGAIGGGGVLLLGLIIAVVCLFAFGRGRTPVAQKDAAKVAATANNGATLGTAESESNPQVSAEEKNPEVNAATAAAPDDKSSPPADVSSSAPAAGSSTRTETPAPAEAKAAESTPTSETKPEPKAKPEPKPEPPPEPKPAAKPEAKPAAKPAPAKATPKPEPFKGFAKAVLLPELPETAGGQPMTGALDPLPLGTCKLDEQTALAIVLHVGDTPVRGSKQKFDLQPKAGTAREWDVTLSGAGTPAVIANLSVKDNNLQFQWTDEAVKQAPAARQLCNCALDLTAGAAQHNVALRTPELGAPLVVEIDKANPGVKWPLADVPAPKQVYIQVTRVEEIRKYRQDPKLPVSIGDSLQIWAGEDEKSLPLGLNLVSSTTARGVEIKLQPQVKFESGQKSSLYRRKDIVAMQTQVAQELPLMQQQLEQAKRDRPSTNPAKAAIETQLINDRKAKLTVDLEKRDALLKQLTFITSFAENFQGAARIHFRVYCQAGPTQIDLLMTEEETPKAKAK